LNGHSAATVTKLALLVDGDNISASYLPLIMYEAGKCGVVAVRRVYGQFKSGRMKSWLKYIDEFELTAVDVSPLTHGKNATDMKLVIEAMDMLHGRQLDGVCIASSDGDFAPLVARLGANALAVYGFGAKKAPAAYKGLFDRFFECDTLLAAEKKPSPGKASPPRRPAASAPAKSTRKQAATPKASETSSAREAIPEAALITALAESKSDWTPLSTLGHLVRRTIPDFTAKKYGYRSMTDLVEAMPGLESRKESGNRIFVRRK
jgi:hypothetical protein